MENSFGVRLKQLRLKNGLTQREIAQKIGLSPAGYFNYENSKAQPKLDVIIKLKEIFDVNIDWLLFGTGHIDRAIEFNDKIMNDDDFIEFFYWLNKEQLVRHSTLANFSDLKIKYPGLFKKIDNKRR